MEQICINTPQSIFSIVTAVIAGVAYLNNLIPAPENINNPVLKFISKILHFIGADITTAAK